MTEQDDSDSEALFVSKGNECIFPKSRIQAHCFGHRSRRVAINISKIETNKSVLIENNSMIVQAITRKKHNNKP